MQRLLLGGDTVNGNSMNSQIMIDESNEEMHRECGPARGRRSFVRRYLVVIVGTLMGVLILMTVPSPWNMPMLGECVALGLVVDGVLEGDLRSARMACLASILPTAYVVGTLIYQLMRGL